MLLMAICRSRNGNKKGRFVYECCCHSMTFGSFNLYLHWLYEFQKIDDHDKKHNFFGASIANVAICNTVFFFK